MKSVSFLKSWKKRDSKVSKGVVEDDRHLPLQYSIAHAKGGSELITSSSPLPIPTRPTSSAPSSLPSLPTPPFRESFSNSVEEALQYRRGTEQRASANYPSTPHSTSSSRMVFHPSPSFPIRSVGSPNRFHGPPRNEKHGPAGILQSQLSSINSSNTDLTFPPSHSYPQHRIYNSQIAEESVIKARSPTRVKFDTTVHILEASRHSKSTPNILDKPVGSHQRLSVPTSGTEVQEATKPSHRRDSTPSRTEEIHSQITKGPLGLPFLDANENRSRRVLCSTRSTPHLRPPAEYPFKNDPLPPLPSPSDDDLSSLFPVPPPLNIRKKRPQPLILRPQTPLHTSSPTPSPNSASTDSTFVITPPSSSAASQFPLQMLLPVKSPLGRKGSAIPPMLHNPPTSPLPSPPCKPSPPASNGVLMTHSLQSLGRLKASHSVTNLRMDGTLPSLPTHRMTSSDPTKQRRASPLKLDPNSNTVGNSSRYIDRKEERAPSPQEGTVQWGYAL